MLLGILVSEGQETARVELGSRRGFVPSWMGGKYLVFRQFQVVCDNGKERDKLLLQEVFLLVLILLRMKVMLCNLFVTILDCIICEFDI
jgi:hypothetical protein